MSRGKKSIEAKAIAYLSTEANINYLDLFNSALGFICTNHTYEGSQLSPIEAFLDASQERLSGFQGETRISIEEEINNIKFFLERIKRHPEDKVMASFLLNTKERIDTVQNFLYEGVLVIYGLITEVAEKKLDEKTGKKFDYTKHPLNLGRELRNLANNNKPKEELEDCIRKVSAATVAAAINEGGKPDNDTPLHYAAKYAARTGKYDKIRVLLKAGAVATLNQRLQTPYDLVSHRHDCPVNLVDKLKLPIASPSSSPASFVSSVTHYSSGGSASSSSPPVKDAHASSSFWKDDGVTGRVKLKLAQYGCYPTDESASFGSKPS